MAESAVPLAPLPVDPLLPELAGALRAGRAAVLEAPPGAGKTTRVPRALHEAGLAAGREVLVLEPRRLAARLAARRVARELGEEVGETAGYQVRFEERAGPRTRIRFVTEGLFTRRLLADPSLRGAGLVVLDEFHERHLHADLALGWLRRLQQGVRPDLKVVVMSATLDAGPVAGFLGARAFRSEGRRFEVAVEHLSAAEAARGEPLERMVARALRRLVSEGLAGDALVFLPGAAEIRRAGDALEPLAAREDLEVLPLHGDLPPEEQERAIRPGPRRKVILSTNVAESSVTVEGVAAVVDSGLARVASHSPWSGLPALQVRKVSRASAAQRAGRAGRLRPGRCLRLYTRHDHDGRPEHDPPEVRREDLAEPLLALALLGAGEDFRWLEPPPEPAARAARRLLADLGALDGAGRPTDLGRRLADFPLHPRQARLLVEAESRGATEGGALLAALLGERDVRERFGRGPRPAPPSGPSDLLELAHLVEEAKRERFDPGALRRRGLAAGAVAAVDRARRQLLGLCRRPARRPGERDEEEALLRATLAAYPDRVARRRAPGSEEVLLAGGGAARLDEASVVREAELLVAVDAEERRGRRTAGAGAPGRAGTVVRLASAATREMLLDLFPGSLRYREELRWNPAGERVEATEQLLYRDLLLDEERRPPADAGRAAELLAAAALEAGPGAFASREALDRLLARVAFASRLAPQGALAPLAEEDARAALRDLCAGRRSFAELRQAGLEAALLGRLPPPARALLERLAPERLSLPGGRSVRVHYPAGGEPPWIESRLQDFFGLSRGPALAGGAVPVVLRLLAPNGRPVQVTTDLAGFWARHYPAVRRELARRYPRHAWPEDPLAATPPPPVRR